MRDIKNTAYKVKCGYVSDSIKNSLNIEDGAIIKTESGYYVGEDNIWNKMYLTTYGGWADYNNSNTSLQTALAGQWTQLTNDGNGIYTNTDNMPKYTTSLFNNNAVDLTNIPLGTVVTIRIDITLSVSSNSDVLFRVNFKDSNGVEVYNTIYDYRHFKSSGTLNGVNMYTFYVGQSILNGSADVEINPDNNTDYVFNGIFITIP